MNVSTTVGEKHEDFLEGFQVSNPMAAQRMFLHQGLVFNQFISILWRAR
jgi:hypothetical protein